MDEPTITTSNVQYFGCIGQIGHHLFDVNERHLNYDRHPLAKFLDGGFLRLCEAPDIKAREGWVYVTRIGTSWTVLSFWDHTVDGRPGSNSNFILPGAFSYKDAMDWSRQAFPQVFARFNTFERCLKLAHFDGFSYPEAQTSA